MSHADRFRSRRPRHGVTRRQVLGALGLGGMSLVLGDLGIPLARPARAAALDGPPLLVFAYVSGGWDTLLSIDPRDHTSFGDAGGSIYTGFELVADEDPETQTALDETGNTGIYQANGSPLQFGPAIGRLKDHSSDLCVIRGIDMGTLTHEVGRRYFLTGKFPRGLLAAGSSLPTWVVNDTATDFDLPNLVANVETYNEGLNPAASGVSIQKPDDLQFLMTQIQPEYNLGASTNDAVEAYLDGRIGSCQEQRLDGGGLVTTFHASRPNAKALGAGTLWEHFDFGSNSAEITALRNDFGLSGPQDVNNPAFIGATNAMIAAQALKFGISQAVSIAVATGMDHHDDNWTTDHAPGLRGAFNAIADLIGFLKAENLWARTTLVVWSEFARTPRVNGRFGRDHHLANACLLAGAGIKGNTLIGGTNDTQYASQPIDLKTGAVSESGHLMSPSDVHATTLTAMGLSYDHILNQSPKLIEAALA